MLAMTTLFTPLEWLTQLLDSWTVNERYRPLHPLLVMSLLQTMPGAMPPEENPAGKDASPMPFGLEGGFRGAATPSGL